MFTLRDTINIDEQGFWKLFLDEEFGRALHCDHLRYASFEITEQHTDENHVFQRHIAYKPRIPDMPSHAAKLVGDGSYTEIGVYDPRSRTYTATITPNKGASHFSTHAEIRAEPLPGRQCERILTVDNKVNIFGLGRIVEKLAENTMRRASVDWAEFVNRWIRERGL